MGQLGWTADIVRGCGVCESGHWIDLYVQELIVIELFSDAEPIALIIDWHLECLCLRIDFGEGFVHSLSQ